MKKDKEVFPSLKIRNNYVITMDKLWILSCFALCMIGKNNNHEVIRYLKDRFLILGKYFLHARS